MAELGMNAETILDRFTDDVLSDLERYYLYTLQRVGAPHQPVRVARLLMRLTVPERNCLSDWALRNFAPALMESHDVLAATLVNDGAELTQSFAGGQTEGMTDNSLSFAAHLAQSQATPAHTEGESDPRYHGHAA
jgi:hypothetical protein